MSRYLAEVVGGRKRARARAAACQAQSSSRQDLEVALTPGSLFRLADPSAASELPATHRTAGAGGLILASAHSL